MKTYSMTSLMKRWAFAALACAVGALAVLSTPALAQDGPDPEKTEQMKAAYAAFQQAAKQNSYETAYQKLEEASRLADEAGQSGALKQLQQFQQRLPTKWGNEALKEKNYQMALMHFRQGEQFSPQDPYVFYGQGLALINMDSTETALGKMQEAVEVGNATGNTRVANTASDRIQQEFVSRASQALSKSNPSPEDAETAITALDKMREYVDPSAKSLFYRSRALQVLGDHEDAITTAEEGLDMHQGSRSDAAKYYFIIAESQMSSGQTSSACSTFQNATYGDYKARAEHYLENECGAN